MICQVTGVDILADKVHHVYKPSKGAIDQLLKLGKWAPKLPSSEGTSQVAPSSQQAPSSSHAPPCPQGLPPSGSKKKSILSFISQGLFACFNVGKHNAQEIRAHRQHVDEQLIRLETRQKALLARHNIEHSPVHEPMNYPPPPQFYNPWEEYGQTIMMYGAPSGNIDDEELGDDETNKEDSPPAAHSPRGSDD